MNEINQDVNQDSLYLLRYLLRIGKSAELGLDTLLSEVDLTASRLLALRHLEQSDEPISLSQLAACMAFVKSNATQLIDRLEADHLVKRIPDPNDRRCTQLEVTEEGRQRHQAAMQAIQPLVEKLQTLYTPEEQAQLVSLLQRLEATLSE